MHDQGRILRKYNNHRNGRKVDLNIHTYEKFDKMYSLNMQSKTLA